MQIQIQTFSMTTFRIKRNKLLTKIEDRFTEIMLLKVLIEEKTSKIILLTHWDIIIIGIFPLKK